MLLAGVVLPTVAAAQASGRRINFDLRGRAQYDSNVARASKTAADAADIPAADIRYTVSGGVDGTVPIGRQSVFLRGSVAYDFYQKNKSLERWRADLQGGGSWQLGPCAGGVNTGYRRVLAEMSPITLTDPRNSVENVTTLGTTASCPIFGSIGGTASVQQRWVSASGSLSQVDSQSTTYTTAVGYVSRTFGSVSVVGALSKTDYSSPPRAVVATARGFETYSVGLQYSRPIGTRMTGSAGINYFELHRSESAGSEALTGGDTSGTSWSANFGYRASDRLSANVGYSDSVGTTTQIGSAYQHEKRFNVGLNYKASRRLSASVDGFRVSRNFSGAQSGQLGVASTERRTGYGAGMSYEVGRNINVSLDVSRSKVETDQSLLNYTSDRAGVTVSASF